MSSSRDIQDHLQKVAAGRNTRQRILVFDRMTRKLKVVDQAEAGSGQLTVATSIDAVSSDKLEALLQCSICLEALDNPRTLPCFHSYCKCCLERFVNNIRQNKPDADLQCPFCRSEFTLGQEGVEGMTPNHFICNMIEVIAIQDQVKLDTCIPCSHCQKPSIGRCVTCEIFMCEKCFQPHNSYPGFRHHCVLTMEELSKDENRSKIIGSSYCKEHDYENKLKFFCETCDKLICRYCMDFDHLRPEHTCLLMKKEAEKKREALKINCATLERKLSEGNQTLEELTNVAQSLEDNLGEVKRRIKKREDQILTRTRCIIERKSQSLIEEANKVFNDKQSVVVKKKQQLQTYVNTVKPSADVSSSLLANGNDEDIILSQNAVQTNVEKVEMEYPRDAELYCYDDEILTYNSEQIDAMLMKEVVEDFGNYKEFVRWAIEESCTDKESSTDEESLPLEEDEESLPLEEDEESLPLEEDEESLPLEEDEESGGEFEESRTNANFYASSSYSKYTVQYHLQKGATGANTGRSKLSFDPTTGKLKIVNVNPIDNVVCTRMSEAGFF